jgi:hypothetical protein
MDLKQGGRSVHDYSKQFNHLAQYAPLVTLSVELVLKSITWVFSIVIHHI